MKPHLISLTFALCICVNLSAQTFRFQYSHDTLGNRTSRVYQGLVPTKSGASLQDTGVQSTRLKNPSSYYLWARKALNYTAKNPQLPVKDSDSIQWIPGGMFIVNCLDEAKKDCSVNKLKFWLSGRNRIKNKAAKKQLDNFIEQHIRIENGRYDCIFSDVEDLRKTPFLESIRQVLTIDNCWMVAFDEIGFGRCLYSAYLFSINTDESLSLKGIAIGEPITSDGPQLLYTVRDNLFIISNRDTIEKIIDLSSDTIHLCSEKKSPIDF